MDSTARVVRFDRYGGTDVLYIAEVPMPAPPAGEVLVRVRAAGIAPGESFIRLGEARHRFPGPLPSGQGSDLSGVVLALGDGVTDLAVGDEVLGYSWRRSSHATHVVVPTTQLVLKPAELSWERAGALYGAGCAAFAAVRAVNPQAGETVAVSAAAGGVGSLVVQMLARRGVQVLGIASSANAAWLADHGAVQVDYGVGLRGRLTAAAPNGIDAFLDLFGPEYLRLAVDLGVPLNRINTIISHDLAEELGITTEGSAEASTQDVLSELAEQVISGQLEFTIAATYPLERVVDAFTQLEKRHTHGKIVLLP